MVVSLDPQQIVSSEELLMSQVVSNEAIIRCLWRRGYLVKRSF